MSNARSSVRIGDVAIGDDGQAQPSCHHIVLGLADGSTRGGHLLARDGEADARSGPDRSPGDASTKDGQTFGIALIDLGTAGG